MVFQEYVRAVTEQQERVQRVERELHEAVKGWRLAPVVEAIQALRGRADGAVINAAAYTHTSLAVRDALLAVRVPFVEVHLSNIFAREPERRHSALASGAVAVLCGFGAYGYELALRGLAARLASRA
ncbi:MAG: type II 3-dehydroquinate dehydratase [Vicinamibacterales bacterium]